MRIEVIHPREMSASHVARWRIYQTASDGLGSPFLTPDWARLIGAVRADARVAILSEDGETRGFFGVQRPSRFAAMGLGAPISDYQAVIAAPGVHAPAGELCRAFKVGRIDLTHVPADQSFFAPYARGEDGSWIVDTRDGGQAYLAGLRERRAEFVRRTERKRRKLESQYGPVRFTANAKNGGDFQQMLAWKRAQLKRSGQPAIWNTPWVAEVLARTFDRHSVFLSGVMFTLHAGEKLVAANYFLRSEAVMHDWIMAHDPAFEPYSPGVLLALLSVEWAGDNGVDEVDFGPGDYQFKRQLATGQRMLAWGSAAHGTASGLVRDAAYAARARIERLPNPRLAALPGKAMRKLDLWRGLAAPAR